MGVLIATKAHPWSVGPGILWYRVLRGGWHLLPRRSRRHNGWSSHCSKLWPLWPRMLLHGFGIRRVRGTGPYGWVGVYFRVREFWGACRVAGGMEPNARLRRECSGCGAVMGCICFGILPRLVAASEHH